MTPRSFWIWMIADSDLGPRLRFPFEFAAVAVVIMALSGWGVRQLSHLADRAIASEAPSVFSSHRNWSMLEYAETGRWIPEGRAPVGGHNLGEAQMTDSGDWYAAFLDDKGGPGLRGRQIVWRLQPASPWTANVLFWVCQPEGPDGSSVEQASLPSNCKE